MIDSKVHIIMALSINGKKTQLQCEKIFVNKKEPTKKQKIRQLKFFKAQKHVELKFVFSSLDFEGVAIHTAIHPA